MKKLYNDAEPLSSAMIWIGTILCGAAYIVCCLPSFYWIGKFGLQITSAVILSFCVTAIAFYFVPHSLKIIGNGLSLFLVAMLIYALYHQIQAQMMSGAFHFWWMHTFFYDRPFTVAMVWCTSFVSILLLRLFLPFQEKYAAFRIDFADFFRVSFRYFLFFYVLMLLYCFILQRKPGGESGFNLIPFTMILSYFQSFRYAYETIFYVLGNLLCFLPFGFYVYVRNTHPSIWRILLTPVVISLLIEVSQLLFNMGHFDVDDILMNAAGFYAGYAFAYLFDLLRNKITKGEESSVFFKA